MPPAVADKLPPEVKVIAGNAIAALLNTIVKLRKLVKPVKLGNRAPLFTLRKETSRILDCVPPNTGAEVPKSLAKEPNKISEAAEVTATVVVPPVAVIAPVCVMLPPEVIERFCPIVDAAIAVAILLVNETLFAPLLDKVIAPVKTLALFKVIALAPALKLEVPGAVNTPV